MVERELVAQETPSVFIFNNIPAIPNGRSAYTYVDPNIPTFSQLDVDRLLTQVVQLRKDGQTAEREMLNRTLDLVSEVVTVKQDIDAVIARGVAASTVLKATGLDEPSINIERVAGTGSTRDIERGIPQSLLAKNCYQCHTGDNPKAGFSMDDPNGFDVAKVLLKISTKEMPPADVSMDESERLPLITEVINLVKEQETQE